MKHSDTSALIRKLDKLQVKDDDILVFRMSAGTTPERLMGIAEAAAMAAAAQGVRLFPQVIALAPGEELTTMSDEQLKELGLMRRGVLLS